MLSHASTPSIYTSEYVFPLQERQISFMKSTPWPLRGHLGRKTDPWGFCAGTWGSVQEESTKGNQRDPGICHEGDGTCTISIPLQPFRFSTLVTDMHVQRQGTKDVRLDPQLNKKVWEAGIKGVPYRLRVRISRKRNDEEGAKEKLYSYVQAVNVKNPKGLTTVVVEDA